jgi:hypothetical protein
MLSLNHSTFGDVGRTITLKQSAADPSSIVADLEIQPWAFKLQILGIQTSNIMKKREKIDERHSLFRVFFLNFWAFS